MNARVQVIREMHVCTHAPTPSKVELRAALERDMAAFEANGGCVTDAGGFEHKPFSETPRKAPTEADRCPREKRKAPIVNGGGVPVPPGMISLPAAAEVLEWSPSRLCDRILKNREHPQIGAVVRNKSGRNFYFFWPADVLEFAKGFKK